MVTLLYSFTVFFEGFAYTAARPKFYKYILFAIVVNILITLVLVMAMVFGLGEVYSSVLDRAALDLPAYLDIFSYFIFVVFSLLLAALLFNSLSMIVNSVIYGELTEKILNEKGFVKYRDIGAGEDIVRSILFEVKKTLLLLLLFIIFFVIGLIPVLGTIFSSVSGVIILILFTSLDLFDPILGRRDYKFRQKLKFAIKNYNIWPFALISGTLNSIPLINIFSQPFSIVGAVILFSRMENNAKIGRYERI